MKAIKILICLTCVCVCVLCRGCLQCEGRANFWGYGGMTVIQSVMDLELNIVDARNFTSLSGME